MKTLLVYRNWSGVGDWIMAMTVLKMVNQQFPEIDIYVNLLARNKFSSNPGQQKLPVLVREIINNFDVRIKGHVLYPEPKEVEKVGEYYDYVSGHMGYEKDGTNFIKGMVKMFRKNTGLDLKYDKDVFSNYVDSGIGYSNTFEPYKPFVLMQACSKKKCLNRQGKDYGVTNMDKICTELSKYVTVFQIGQKTDWFLSNVKRFLSVDLDLLHLLMKNCVAFVGMDGGLGVYASHHGVKNIIIYEEAKRFSWTNFPHRKQIDGNLDFNEVSNLICDSVKSNLKKEETI
ncbi:MAG: hypothetical protein GY821_12675 [Gammaproteobacteria bacterium]|nr:hypothetical protein [Gammaproteobacteria bacterium]